MQLTPGARAGRLAPLAAAAATLHSRFKGSVLAKGALLAFGVRVASAAILYCSQVLLARWMGDTGYGIYVSAWVWVLLLGGTAHLGGGLAMMRLVPELAERGEHQRLRGLLVFSRTVPLLVGTTAALAGLALLWLLAPGIDPVWLAAMTAALCAVPAHAMTEVSDGIGRGRGWFGLALVPPYLVRPLLIVALVAIWHLTVGPLTAPLTAMAALAATWAVAVGQALLLDRALNNALPAGPRTFMPRAWLAASMPLLVTGACDLAIQNVDLIVVSHVLEPAMAGIYFAAAKTMALIQFINYAVGSAAAHRFATLAARGGRAGLAATVRWAVGATFWPSLAGAAALLVLGLPLLSLFGPRFVEGWPVMVVLVLGFLARAALGPADILLNAVGAQRLSAMALAAGALLDVVLNLALVPSFGLIGAATATSLSIVVVAAGNWMIARRVLGLDLGFWSGLSWPAAPSWAQLAAKYRAIVSS